MTLPFWSKISERGKQTLAVLAVLQAIHFAVTVPLGIYDGWRWSKDFEENIFAQSRREAAQNAILSTLWANENNRFLYGYGYKEDCLSQFDEDDSFERFGSNQSDCDDLKPLSEIIDHYVQLYVVPEDEMDILMQTLRIVGGLPV